MTFSNRNRTLAAALLATVTFSLPAIAQAQSYSSGGYAYNDCKRSDKKNQLAGGILGAVAGAVIGSQISGNGVRTEGSAIGAVIGGAAGAGIGDDLRNCNRETGTTTYTSGSYDAGTTTTYGSSHGYQPSSYTTSSYPTTYSGGTTYTSPTYTSPTYTTVYTSPTHVSPTYTSSSSTYYSQPTPTYTTVSSSHGSHSGYRSGGRAHKRLDNVDRRIANLRAEREQIQRRRYARHDHYAERRLNEIGRELRTLKNRKRTLKKRVRQSATHYHGNQACYSAH